MEEDLHYYELLSKSYPSIQDAATEIINLKAILHLPKATEHYLSDIHGEYDAFSHMVRSASGTIRQKIEETLTDRTEEEKNLLATIIYYPKEKLDLLNKQNKLDKEFYEKIIFEMVEVAKYITSKYTISKVRKAISPKFIYIIEELLQSHSYTFNKEDYYHSIIKSIIETGMAESLIYELSSLIRILTVDQLHILGDIYDRGIGAYRCMELIMSIRNVDITWGNHDIVYMGAAAGDPACVANVIRTSCRYNHLCTLEDGYGISLRPLVTFAMKVYGDDPCTQFIPSDEEANQVEDYDTEVIAKMHKAISIILFKLEGQLIDNHPEYEGEYLKKLDKIDFEKGTYKARNKTYKLMDNRFETINPADPYALTADENELMDKLVARFKHCEKLNEHVDFLFTHGSMYKEFNDNLIYHGCIPMNSNGTFMVFKDKDGKEYSGKKYLDYLDKEVRKAYYSNDSSSLDKDIFYYLWCFADSPLFGKKDIITFETLFLSKEDRTDFTEEKNPYYLFVTQKEYCIKILQEFNITSDKSIIINGHIPVKVKTGESPIKADGKYIIIDGGLSEAYHSVTGIAGYTLVYNSHGLKLVAHDVFLSKEDAIKNNTDIAHEVERIALYPNRITVRESDVGKKIVAKISDLEKLLSLYVSGTLKVR